MRPDRCAWPRCQSFDIALTYLRCPLCQRHWQQFCAWDEVGRGAEARAMLGLPPRPVIGDIRPFIQGHGVP